MDNRIAEGIVNNAHQLSISLVNDEIDSYLTEMGITYQIVQPKYQHLYSRIGKRRVNQKVMVEAYCVLSNIGNTWYKFSSLCVLYRTVKLLEKSGHIKKPKKPRK